MGQVGDLIGAQGAAAAGVLGPAEHPGLEEGAIDDQLTAALEQIEQAYLALGSIELVRLVHSQPRHPPAFSGQRVTGAGQGLLLDEELLARSLPLLLRHDRGCVHREMPFPVFLVSHFACCHLISPVLSETGRDDSLLKTLLNLPMHTAKIPPVDPAPATITAVLAMHAGHMCPSPELLMRPRLSALPVLSLPAHAAEPDSIAAVIAAICRSASFGEDPNCRPKSTANGSGKMSSFPASMPSRIANATSRGEVFGSASSRTMSVSTGPA